MHFAIQKENLVKALRDVTSALATRVVQPILSNVLIEAKEGNILEFQATDLDLTIKAKVSGTVAAPGSVTLPGKKLLEIVAKLPNEVVNFMVDKDTLETSVTCKRSKFNVTGLSADDFPKQADAGKSDGVWIPTDTLRKAIGQTAFAAAGYDASGILGGVYMVIDKDVFECSATDGSRLAHRHEVLNVGVSSGSRADGDKEREGKNKTATLEKPTSVKAIIPARACSEVVKIVDGDEVRLSMTEGQLVFETDRHYISTRLIGGEYPKYQELFPTDYKYLASIKREEAVSAIERVSVMSDDRTHLIKMHFEGDDLNITANTPDVGRAQEELAIKFEGQVLDIAVNVRYMLDVLQRLNTVQVVFEMTGALKPVIIKGVGDDNYKYLLMPVQAK